LRKIFDNIVNHWILYLGGTIGFILAIVPFEYKP
jgi:hypothetical protein